MFQDVEELKEFIIWAKEQGLKRAKIGDTEFEISDVSLALALQEVKQNNIKEELDATKTMLDTESEISMKDDPDLFWSSDS